MLIKKENTSEYQHSPACTVWEYEFSNKNFSCARAYIDGRYPKTKKVMNLDCEETYFVISGSGTIHSQKSDIEINEGDIYVFDKEEVYRVEGKQLFLILTSIPKRTPEQHKTVE